MQKRVLLVIISFLVFGFLCAQHYDPVYEGNGYQNMTIIVNSATIDGEDMQAGDEIGIFDGEICVGSGVLEEPLGDGVLLSISASADDPLTTEVDGFIEGNTIIYKLWDTSEAVEYTNIDETYSMGNGNFAQLGTALVGLSGYLLPGTIEGSVLLDSGSGDVTNVIITAGEETTSPAGDGSYSIEIHPGVYDVTAELSNYESSTSSAVEVLEDTATTGIDFSLTPLPGSVSGTVTLTNGSGDITMVEVTAAGQTVNPSSDGTYSIDGLAPGSYDVSATLANYEDATAAGVVVVENANTGSIDLELVAIPGSIQGTITLTGGTASVTEVQVSVVGQTVNPSADGTYTIDELVPGFYDVTASLENYEEQTITDVEVVENANTTDINFTIDPLPGSISGTVSLLNREGDITQVEVTAAGQTVNPSTDGIYSIVDIDPGTYTVTASLTNYEDASATGVEVVENTNTANIDLELIALPGTIEGTITLSGGSGEITAVQISAGSQTTNPNAEGYYSITIQPGTYDVVASLANYEQQTTSDVQVLENQVTSDVDFTLTPLPGYIAGEVSIAGGSGDVTDVAISVDGSTYYPDSEGSYNIELTYGSYDLTAELANYETYTQNEIEVEENQTTNINITMNPLPGSISGTVTLLNREGDITQVEVTAGGQTVNPDSEGNYTIAELEPGTYNVTASLENYADDTVTDVIVVENQNTADINLNLVAYPGSIKGNIALAADEGDVTNIEVSAGGQTVNPDEFGDYEIELAPGTYDVTAESDNYFSQTISGVEVLENQVTADIDFTLEARYGAISGHVTVIGGDGDVEDVIIEAGDYTTSPTADGNYTLTDIFPANYDVSATLTDYPVAVVNDVAVLPEETTTDIDFQLISGPPVINFTAQPDSGCVPLEVQFTDLSSNEPYSWNWDFGNGDSSTEQNPVHTYDTAGLYDVTLEATNEAGTSSFTMTEMIKVGQAPAVDFTADPTIGYTPLAVEFNNITMESPGFPTTWNWDFGDGNTSSEEEPTHVYDTAGIFTVSLTATNACGEDELTFTDYITVGEPLVADFEATPLSGTAPLEVQFTSLATGGMPPEEITSYEWDFDDDGTIDSNEENPVWTYPNEGIYSVALTIYDELSEATEVITDYIEVLSTSNDPQIPAVTRLNGNYPNPFNPTTQISFSLKQTTKVKLEILNVKGQVIKTLLHTTKAAGNYNISWNGDDQYGNSVASGIYFARMQTEEGNFIEKMLMLK